MKNSFRHSNICEYKPFKKYFINPKSNSNGFRKILGIEQLPNALKTKCSTITFVKFQSKKKR